MKREECKFVRYTASEGKSLKYRLRFYKYDEVQILEICALRDATIDENLLVGDVEEISREEYMQWFNTEGRNFAVGAL